MRLITLNNIWFQAELLTSSVSHAPSSLLPSYPTSASRYILPSYDRLMNYNLIVQFISCFRGVWTRLYVIIRKLKSCYWAFSSRPDHECSLKLLKRSLLTKQATIWLFCPAGFAARCAARWRHHTKHYCVVTVISYLTGVGGSSAHPISTPFKDGKTVVKHKQTISPATDYEWTKVIHKKCANALSTLWLKRWIRKLPLSRTTILQPPWFRLRFRLDCFNGYWFHDRCFSREKEGLVDHGKVNWKVVREKI